MEKVFNMGIGMVLVLSPDEADKACETIRTSGIECTQIGTIQPAGKGTVNIV